MKFQLATPDYTYEASQKTGCLNGGTVEKYTHGSIQYYYLM